MRGGGGGGWTRAKKEPIKVRVGCQRKARVQFSNSVSRSLDPQRAAGQKRKEATREPGL